MTVTSGSNSPITYTGNGAVDTFSTGTNIFYAATDLVVTERVIATGVETTYVKDTDYTVTGGNGSTGSITLVAGNLPSTKRITIEVSIPYSQASQYTEGESILADELETSLDKNVIMAQQNNALLSRALKFTASLASGLTPVISEAPVDGKALTWSGATGTVVNADFASLTTTIDTTFSGLASGDFFQYNGSNWVNKTVAEVKTALDLKLNNYAATAAPGVGDDSADGYSVGSQWYDGTNDNMYHCLDATVGAAVWVQGDVVAADLGAAATKGFIDDDTFATASATSAASSESIKAYVDAAIVSGIAAIFGANFKIKWARVDGTGTPSITSGSGISSITDNGSGDYTFNFTASFSSATSYIAIGFAGGSGAIISNQSSATAPAAGSCRLVYRDSANTPTDSNPVFALFIGT